MISRTKVELKQEDIAAVCASAGYADIQNVHPLGAGEFNAVYAFDSGGEAYALKIAPGADMPVMTYEHDMMRSEVFWYGQLQKHTDVETPEIVHTDFSRSLMPSDFFVMRRVPGTQMNETEFTPQERINANRLLPQLAAKMHQIRHKGYGYPQNGFYDTWAKALTAMTEAMITDAAKMGQPCENGERMLRLIRKHTPVLNRADCRMVNFDLWEANIICTRKKDGFHYVMIDPERGYWGDPLMDFICFETDKPLKAKQASLQAYNQLAERPIAIGRDEEIRFAFAQAYLGVIMEVERYFRYVPGDEGWTRNDRVYKQLFSAAFSCLDEV